MGEVTAMGGRVLGPRVVELDEMVIPADVSVDVQSGSVGVGTGAHHLRIVLVNQRRAILVPCTPQFLRTLMAQCAAALGNNPSSDENGDKIA